MPGEGRRGEQRRHAGDDLEGHALLVQEQRFGAAAIEHERVAPLEPRDHLALARLFGERKLMASCSAAWGAALPTSMRSAVAGASASSRGWTRES